MNLKKFTIFNFFDIFKNFSDKFFILCRTINNNQPNSLLFLRYSSSMIVLDSRSSLFIKLSVKKPAKKNSPLGNKKTVKDFSELAMEKMDKHETLDGILESLLNFQIEFDEIHDLL